MKIVARPDARMVEVPLEFECELPREFDGQAVLASSGVPRKVHLKAGKDGVKISTAYRADVLLADIVRLALRGSVGEMQKVQEAAQKFVRLVRERRQDGAALNVALSGGKIEVSESGTSSPGPARPSSGATPSGPLAAAAKARPGPAVSIVKPPPGAPARPGTVGTLARPGAALPTPAKGTPVTPFAARPPPPVPSPPDPALLEKLSALERRVSQLEAALPRLLEAREEDGGLTTRLAALEQALESSSGRNAELDQKVDGMHGELRASEAESATRIGLLQQRLDHVMPPLWQDTNIGADPRRGTPRKSTAVDAFAQGLRVELRGRIAAALAAGNEGLPKLDKAAALAAEAALSLGVPANLAEDVRALAGQTAARHQALERLSGEVDFYEASDLPVAALLVERLERQPVPDASPALRAVVVAAGAGQVDEAHLADFIARAAVLCGDEPFQAAAGDSIDLLLHEPSARSQPRGAVVRTVASGVRRKDGTLVRRPRVESSEQSEPPPPAPVEAAKTDAPAEGAAAVGSPASNATAEPSAVATGSPLALPAVADAAPLAAPAEVRGSAPPAPLAADDARIFPALPLGESAAQGAKGEPSAAADVILGPEIIARTNSEAGKPADEARTAAEPTVDQAAEPKVEQAAEPNVARSAEPHGQPAAPAAAEAQAGEAASASHEPAGPSAESKPAEHAAAAPSAEPHEEIVVLAEADQIDDLEEVEPLPTGPIVDLSPEAAAALAQDPSRPAGDGAAAQAGSSPTASSAAGSDSAAPVTAQGDLWGEVNSDSAWASITLDKDGPGDDPWGTPAPDKPADAPASAAAPATPHHD